MNPLTFVSVPYANAVVPTRRLTQVRPGTILRTEVPARLYGLLTSGEADAALVPVVDYLFSKDLALAGEFGIAADGPVESVLLKCRVPPERIRTVAMDPASHTSNVLAELLLREHWKLHAEFGDDPASADAEVAIGDRALSRPRTKADIDLAQAWHTMTGLPFVFAVWACRHDHPRREEIGNTLSAALEAGMKDAPALAAEQARLLGLTAARCLAYMTVSIRYPIGEREQLAMETFKGMIVRRGESLATVRRTALAHR